MILIIVLTLSGCDLFEQKEDIVILYTNDVASNMVEGEVGYDGVKAYKNQMESEYNQVSLVDAGDFFDGKVINEQEEKRLKKIVKESELINNKQSKIKDNYPKK